VAESNDSAHAPTRRANIKRANVTFTIFALCNLGTYRMRAADRVGSVVVTRV